MCRALVDSFYCKMNLQKVAVMHTQFFTRSMLISCDKKVENTIFLYLSNKDSRNHRFTNQHTKCIDIRLSDVYVRH